MSKTVNIVFEIPISSLTRFVSLKSNQSTNASSTRSSVGNTVITIAEDSVFSTDLLDPNASIHQSMSNSPSSSLSPYKISSSGSIKSTEARRDAEFEIQISRNKTVVRETTFVFEENDGDFARFSYSHVKWIR